MARHLKLEQENIKDVQLSLRKVSKLLALFVSSGALYRSVPPDNSRMLGEFPPWV